MVSLLSPARAAVEWGLYEGMAFTRDEADDFLLELFNYMSQRRGAWHALPVYTSKYNAVADNELMVSFERGGSSWEMQFNTPIAAVSEECQRLIKVNVIFRYGGEDRCRATITYLVCKSTCNGFYYISFLTWVARCASVNECMALMDAIAAGGETNELRILAMQYQDDIDLVYFLTNECMPLADPVRLNAIRRKIRMLST